MQYDDFLEEEFDDEIEYDGLTPNKNSETNKLPLIHFKELPKEENENHRFIIFFSLLLAIIGAIIVVAIPVEYLLPANLSNIEDLDISSKLPLLQSMAGAVIGAFIGGIVGFILDLFLNAYKLGKKENIRDSNQGHL